MVAWSCNEDTTKPAEVQQFQGILETDVQCNILGGDTTDFQPRPAPGEPDIYSLKYACPNPAQGKSTSIHWTVVAVDSVWILAFDTPGGSPVDTLHNGVVPPGNHIKHWSYDGPAGIYRIMMFTRSGFTSYGDVQLVE
jgi:hypothetical protein